MSPKIHGVEVNHQQSYNYMISVSPLQEEEEESNRAGSQELEGRTIKLPVGIPWKTGTSTETAAQMVRS